MLELRDVTGGYGSTARVLHGVTLDVAAGEVVVLLGRNGVGKSTLLRATMGLLPRTGGQILLDGEDLAPLRTFQRARRGLGYIPQGRDLFARSSVEQNLRYGNVLAGRSMREPLDEDVVELFPWMRDRSKQRAGTLSGGEQQMVAIARVLIGRPKVLLLDEPTEGLAPVIVRQVADAIRAVAERGELAILLVEQNVGFALDVATRGYIMEKGSVVAAGSTDELGSEQMLARYLSV